MTFVHDGLDTRGFILSRGVAGYEAFDREQQSLGLFRTQAEAAAAIMELQA